MHIVHVITGLPKAAGTSVFCGEVCNALVARGHAVTLMVCNPGVVNQYSLDSRVRLASIESLLRGEVGTDFDVVHIHAMWTPILHKVSKWAKWNRLPVVWSPHGMLAPWAMKHKWYKKFLPWHLYQKRDLKLAKLLHATSKTEMQWIRNLGFTQPITVAPLGTHLPEVQLGKVKREKNLLYVGRIYPVKALDRLIEAFSLVPTEIRRGWKLRLVGPDQAGHQKNLQSLVKCLKLDGVVEFPGPKFGKELLREYEECESLALVSHTENFGATVVDALSYSKPVIASTNTPWYELSENGCGWWISNSPDMLSEALFEMMSLSDADRRQMGERGRKLVEEKYTWDAVVEKVINGYTSMLSQ